MAGHAARYHRYHGAVATPSRFKGRPRQARACDERAFETCHIKVQLASASMSIRQRDCRQRKRWLGMCSRQPCAMMRARLRT